MQMRSNYLTMDKDDMVRSGISGNRLKLSLMLSSKNYDIFQIVLIVIYCFLMIVTFMVEDIFYADQKCDKDFVPSKEYIIFHNMLILAEILILLVFTLDIGLHICGYGWIFLQDCWNLVDAVVILFNILLVIVDSQVSSGIIKSILKLRGFFRLIRIFVLMRKVNQVKVKSDRRRKFSRLAISDGLELKTV